MLKRVLEPEVMDTRQEALDYNRMDHRAVNEAFARDLLMAAAAQRVSLAQGTVLDLGTGTALIPIELCRQQSGLRLVGLDAAREMLALARRNLVQAGLQANIELALADAKQLPYADGSFSAVISNSIVHHIPRPELALAEAVRVARPGGLMFFRDLLRPHSQAELNQLVKQYAGGENAHARKMFADSLHAALSLAEVRQMIADHGFDPEYVQQTSDRHWTWVDTKPLTRRAALRAGAAVTMSAALGTQTRAAPATGPFERVIDSHQHLWELKRFNLPWVAGDAQMARDYTMSDYLKATAGIPIVKSVYVEVDVDPAQQQAEADYVSELCRRGDSPLAAAVISGRPESADFARYAQQFRDHPYIRGVRRLLHRPDTPRGYCLQQQFVENVQVLGNLGLSFDITMRGVDLSDAPKLIDGCPGTFFILDHCGNPNVQDKDQTAWKRDLSAVAERENVVCKVSGIIASVKPGAWSADDLAPIVNHVLDEFGPYRVMFGGDWPVCNLGASYRAWYDALREIVADRPADDQRRLFYDNALRHYRLG
jgi:predicted TIM-barrel fold metal-dependent hydrolase/ubiquinone/menaquinone biosynthesis C-methylase UbiE